MSDKDLQPTGETTEDHASDGDNSGNQNVSQESATVPREALLDERGKRQELEQQLQMTEQQLHIIRANQFQQQPTPQQPVQQEESDPFASLSDDDIVDGKTVKQVVRKAVTSAVTSATNNLKTYLTRSSAEALSLKQIQDEDSNYRQVINEHLPLILAEKPYLQDAIRNSSNRLQYMWDLTKERINKLERQAAAKRQQDTVNEAQKVKQNADKPKSISQAGGGGSGELSEVEKIKKMSPKEFAEYRRKLRNRGGG